MNQFSKKRSYYYNYQYDVDIIDEFLEKTPQKQFIGDYVNTVRSIEPEDFDYIRKKLGFVENLIKDVTDREIELIFTPKNSFYYMNKYHKDINLKSMPTDNDSYEFIGDKVFTTVSLDILTETSGTNIPANTLSKFFQIIASNKLMTQIMMELDLCKYVRTPEGYNTYSEKDKFHNACADTFEAIIGFIYQYCVGKKINPIDGLKFWLYRCTNLIYYIKLTADKYNLPSIYFNLNNKEILKKIKAEFLSDLAHDFVRVDDTQLKDLHEINNYLQLWRDNDFFCEKSLIVPYHYMDMYKNQPEQFIKLLLDFFGLRWRIVNIGYEYFPSAYYFYLNKNEESLHKLVFASTKISDIEGDFPLVIGIGITKEICIKDAINFLYCKGVFCFIPKTVEETFNNNFS